MLWQWLFNGWIVGEVVIAIATRTRGGQGTLKDRGTQIVLWLTIVASFVASGFARGIVAAEIAFHPDWLRIAGLVLLIAGLAVRITAIVTLGRAFSANVAIRTSQTIQRSGFYRVIRHPSYLGMEMVFVAAGLHSRNWISMCIVIVAPTLAVLYRIRVEEEALVGAFGAEYVEYRKTTKRLVPGIY